MSENAWYAFYVGDYARDTAHLSLLEHGAYRLLLDHYYATGHPLPNDLSKLHRICRARSPAERKAVSLVASEFFFEDGTLLRHERCDSVLAKRLEFRERQSAKARIRHSRGTATVPAEPMPTIATTTEEEGYAHTATPFERIYTAGCDAFPALATANTSAISQWVAAGCDPELDIIPEINRHAKAGKAIRAWSYFTGGIMDAKATRETPPPKGTPHENTRNGRYGSPRLSKSERFKQELHDATLADIEAHERRRREETAGEPAVPVL